MNPAPHLILVGPMGAGKTTLGRRLAERLGLPFIDLDHEIETQTGVPIRTIFADEGEAGFRRRERYALDEVLRGPPCVLATGGGAVLDPVNRLRMRGQGFVVCLEIEIETQLKRLARDQSRPLIAGDDREATLQQLAAVRGPLYAEIADLQFTPSHYLSPGAAAEALAGRLRTVWRRSHDAVSENPAQSEPL
jgi:shikimate kinase